MIWKEGTNIEAQQALVKFPLSKLRAEEWFVWKASAEAPLLVYDPQHQGNITTPEQLFGEWTFGGRPKSSESGAATQERSPWDNGFEALSTLDKDGDGRVAGVELEPLGLWFDANRDGASQDGEVKSVSAAGVTALYFSGGHEDASTKSITIKQGFERMVNGVSETGAAVDWYGEGAATRSDLVSNVVTSQLVTTGATSSQGAERRNGPNAPVTTTQDQGTLERGITGAWFWKVKEGELADWNIVDGMLLFDELQGGRLDGRSYIEGHFSGDHRGAARGAFMIAPASGTVSAGTDGNAAINFRIPFDGGELRSIATLSPDKAVLKGSTEYKGNLNGRPRTIVYQWEARRADAILKE